MRNRCIGALYLTLIHSKEDLNCYFFFLLIDNVKTKVQPGVIVCKQWLQRKRGKKMLTTAELTERKNLKNTTEKTERENNFNEITENMFPTPLNMKNSRGEIMKEKQLRKLANLLLIPKKHYLHLHRLLLNIMQQKFDL